MGVVPVFHKQFVLHKYWASQNAQTTSALNAAWRHLSIYLAKQSQTKAA